MNQKELRGAIMLAAAADEPGDQARAMLLELFDSGWQVHEHSVAAGGEWAAPRTPVSAYAHQLVTTVWLRDQLFPGFLSFAEVVGRIGRSTEPLMELADRVVYSIHQSATLRDDWPALAHYLLRPYGASPAALVPDLVVALREAGALSDGRVEGLRAAFRAGGAKSPTACAEVEALLVRELMVAQLRGPNGAAEAPPDGTPRRARSRL